MDSTKLVPHYLNNKTQPYQLTLTLGACQVCRFAKARPTATLGVSTVSYVAHLVGAALHLALGLRIVVLRGEDVLRNLFNNGSSHVFVKHLVVLDFFLIPQVWTGSLRERISTKTNGTWWLVS